MPSTAVTTGSPQLKVDGSPLAGEVARSLIALHVSRSASVASHVMLRFRDVHTAGAEFKVGDKLEVSAADDTAHSAPLFTGVVLGLGIEVVPGATELIVEAFDESHLLGSAAATTSHLNVSMSDVIKKVAKDAGLKVKVDASLATPKFDHIQQSGTTHQFLTELTHTMGLEWFVEKGTLVVQPRRGGGVAATLSGSEDLLYFTARLSAVEQAKSVEVRAWDVQKKQAVSEKVNKTQHQRTVPIEDKTKIPKLKDAAVASNPLFGGADVKAVAKAAANRLAASRLTGRGEVAVDAKIKPGELVEIKDVAPDWNGQYYITSVDHHFGIGQSFITRFTIGALEPTALVDLFGGPQAGGGSSISQGLTVGIVTDNGDTEKLNRVKLKLPYLSEDNVTDWCRVATLGAGNAAGWTVVPNVDDEVLVGFEHGDIQRPYVIGSLWNGKDKPPIDALVTEKGKNVVRSFTTPKGHTLIFSDGDKKPESFVSMATKDDQSQFVLGDETIDLITRNDIPITIKNKDGSVTLGKGGKLTIKAKSITIDAEDELVLKGKNVTVKGQSDVKLDGAKLNLKASGMGSLEAGGIMKVKGSMVNIN